MQQSLTSTRTETGATTAEYAVCTGGAVGLAGVLFKLLSSDFGQKMLSGIFDKVMGLLPF